MKTGIVNWFKDHGRYRIIHRSNDQERKRYLERFYLLSKKKIGQYIHIFWESDDDGLHDHPWWSISIPLKTGFYEEMPGELFWSTGGTVTKFRKPWRPWAPWRIYFRTATDLHRVILPEGKEGQVVTMFIRGPRVRNWGFVRDGKWEEAEYQSRRDIEEEHMIRMMLRDVKKLCVQVRW